MSLSAILDSKEGRAFFARHVRRPRPIEPLSLMVEPMGANPARLGNAFDYAIRFGLQRRGLGVCGPLVAERSVDILKVFNPGLWPRAVRLLKESRDILTSMSLHAGLSARAARACYILGGLDVVYRAVAFDQVGRPATEVEIAELKALYDLVHWAALSGSSRLLLNPSFGEGGSLVGGADADLVRDDEVIDVKTTKHLALDARTIRQVAAYCVLANQYGLNGEAPAERVTRCGVYFARAGELRSFSLDEVCPPSDQEAILAWFLARREDRRRVEAERRLRERLVRAGEAKR